MQHRTQASKPSRVRWLAAAALCLLGLAARSASADELIVLCSGAMKSAFEELSVGWSAKTRIVVKASYAPAGELRRQLAGGAAADIVILPSESLAELEAAGQTRAGSRRDLGSVGIGVAVREGTPLPDVSSEDALRRTLLAAKSISYMNPRSGTSGKHVDEVVLPKLGIAAEVRAKTQLGEAGMVGEKAARGEVELVLQQMTELLPVPGIIIAGELPASLQKTTVYSGAVLNKSASTEAAQALLDDLARSPEAHRVMQAKGFHAAP